MSGNPNPTSDSYGHKNAVADVACWHDGTFWPILEPAKALGL